jgi:hypothetical protein
MYRGYFPRQKEIYLAQTFYHRFDQLADLFIPFDKRIIQMIVEQRNDYVNARPNIVDVADRYDRSCGDNHAG